MSESDTDHRPILCFVDQNTSASNKDSEIYQRVAGKTNLKQRCRDGVATDGAQQIRTFRTQVSNLSIMCANT